MEEFKLSDGTVPEEGMIVTLIGASLGGNKVGVTTEILGDVKNDGLPIVPCAWINKGEKTGIIVAEALEDLRLATEEEIEEYNSL